MYQPAPSTESFVAICRACISPCPYSYHTQAHPFVKLEMRKPIEGKGMRCVHPIRGLVFALQEFRLWVERAEAAACRLVPRARIELQPNFWIPTNTYSRSVRCPSESTSTPLATLRPVPKTPFLWRNHHGKESNRVIRLTSTPWTVMTATGKSIDATNLRMISAVYGHSGTPWTRFS